MIRSVFSFLVLLGTLAIAVPWALFVLVVGLVLAFVLVTFGFTLGQMLIFGMDTIDEPNTLFGWLGYALCVLTGWALVLALWAEHFGIARLFARTRDSHGSARLASKAERRDLAESESGLLIGRDADSGRLLRYDGPAHLLTLAPTRAGKGVGTVIPNLLLVPRPMLVIDPKGENARITYEARARLGPVHVLDPFGVTGLPASAYNPLARLSPDSLDLGEDAASLAEALVMDPPGAAGDAHWNEEAKALLAGLILFAAVHETEDRRTLASVREYLTLPPEQFRALLGLMQESPGAGGLIARAANRFLGKSDREAAGVLSSAQRHTHFLDSPRITASLARSEFSFASLRHERTSVFLVLPPNRLDAYSRWLRLLVSQALAEIARAAETPQGAPAAPGAAQRPQEGSPSLREPTLLLLDEFAALGRLEAVERAMGLMAGYGLQLWPILQGEAASRKRSGGAFRCRTGKAQSQLRALYGVRANTFVANAGVLQTFGVNDYETAKALSQLTGRDLLTPDEIMQMSPHLQLLRLQGRPMILARKLRYHADPEFKGLFPPQSAP